MSFSYFYKYVFAQTPGQFHGDSSFNARVKIGLFGIYLVPGATIHNINILLHI